MERLPLPVEKSEISAVLLPDGKWYELQNDHSMSVGPMIITGNDFSEGDIRLKTIAVKADAYPIDPETGLVSEHRFPMVIPLAAIIAYRLY